MILCWVVPIAPCRSNATMLWSLLCTKPCSSGVLREQGISSDQSHPVDTYHPDFLLGHPVYFDMSVRSTTQSAVIHSASSQAWVAVASKVAKFQDLSCQFQGQLQTGQLLTTQASKRSASCLTFSDFLKGYVNL